MPNTFKTIIYDGTNITTFLQKNGINPNNLRQVLWDSKIGSVFALEAGTPLKIRDRFTASTFSRPIEL